MYLLILPSLNFGNLDEAHDHIRITRAHDAENILCEQNDVLVELLDDRIQLLKPAREYIARVGRGLLGLVRGLVAERFELIEKIMDDEEIGVGADDLLFVGVEQLLDGGQFRVHFEEVADHVLGLFKVAMHHGHLGVCLA